METAFQPGYLWLIPFGLWVPVVGKDSGCSALEVLTAGEYFASPGCRRYLEREAAPPLYRIILFLPFRSRFEAGPAFPFLALFHRLLSSSIGLRRPLPFRCHGEVRNHSPWQVEKIQLVGFSPRSDPRPVPCWLGPSI